MAPSRVVVIGASAGGVKAVSTVIAGLTQELRAAVLVVIHTSRGEDGLAAVLGRGSIVPVLLAGDRLKLADAHVYVARPDRHLAVADGVMRVLMGPSRHGFRPAVDVLFQSAAEAAGPRSAGVILSGALSDGVAGLRAIKRAGGRAIVQNPQQAEFSSMPLAALREVEVDAVLPLGEIAADLMRWARVAGGRKRAPHTEPSSGTLTELATTRSEPVTQRVLPITCPSCGGALSETHELGIREFACHVGHRFNQESLLEGLDSRVEGTLWTAVRALQEKAILRRRMCDWASSRSMRRLAERWRRECRQAEQQAAEVRRLIETVPQPGIVTVAARHRAQSRHIRPAPASGRVGPRRAAGRARPRRGRSRSTATRRD